MISTENNIISTKNTFMLKSWHVIVGALLLFALAFAIENRFVIAPRYAVILPFLGLVSVIAAEAARINVGRLTVRIRRLGILLPLLLLVAGTIIGIYNLSDTYLLYFAGDFYILAQFIVIGLIFSLKNVQDHSDEIFWGYFASIIITSLARFYFSYTKHYAAVGRFIPFDILFVITCAWFAFYRLRLLPLIVLVGLLISYATSGTRLGLCLSALMICLVIFTSRKRIFSGNRKAVVEMILVFILLVVGWIKAPEIASLRTIGRIAGTFQKKEYELVGVESRFKEAEKVIKQLIAKSYINIIFGMGHGALYKGHVAWDLEVNRTEKGTHAIHITPATFFFRYGLLGLTWYLLILFYAISKAKRIVLLRDGETVNDYMAISNLYLCAMLLSSILGANNFIYMDIPIMLYLTANYEKAHRSKYLEQEGCAVHQQPAC